MSRGDDGKLTILIDLFNAITVVRNRETSIHMKEVLRTYDQIWTPSGPLSLPETIKHTVSGVSLMTHDFAELDNDLTISEDDSDAQKGYQSGCFASQRENEDGYGLTSHKTRIGYFSSESHRARFRSECS
jgi:hypothetical protein